MNPAWCIQTGRLLLSPVGWRDLADLQALKCDPRVYGQMLGGVRSPGQVAAELTQDLMFWAMRGVGMWMVRQEPDAAALGMTGLHERIDGRGTALRFAFRPESRGHGLAREAAGAALRFAHDRVGLLRVVAVTRETNIASRTVLGAIRMRPCGTFDRDGCQMLLFESLARPRPDDAWR